MQFSMTKMVHLWNPDVIYTYKYKKNEIVSGTFKQEHSQVMDMPCFWTNG